MKASQTNTGNKLKQVDGAVLFADMANSTGIMEHSSLPVGSSLDGLKIWVAEQVLPAFHGRFVKSTGDGFMAHLPNVSEAVGAAEQILADIRDGRCGVADQIGFGIGSGPFEDGHFDLYGHEVNLAARLSGFANRDEILLTAQSCEEFKQASPALVTDLGLHNLRNLEQQVRIYRVETGLTRRTGFLRLASIRPAIAVLPFQVLDPQPDGLRIGDIVAEEMIRMLSSTELFSVISRLSTARFSIHRSDLRHIGEVLGARYVVSGTMRHVENTGLSLNIEIADSNRQHVLWSSHVTCSLADLLDPQSPTLPDLAGAILRSSLACELEGARTEYAPQPRTYTRLIGAISRMHRLSENEFMQAGEQLRQIVVESPRHAEPRAWLAKWYTLKSQQGWTADERAENEAALTQSQRALDLNPDSSMALSVAGLVHTNMARRFDLAQTYFEHAVRSNPNNPYAWLHRAALKMFTDEGEKSISDVSRALELSPIDPHAYYFKGIAASCALSAGDYEATISIAEESLRENSMHLSSWRAKLTALWMLGREEEARKAAQRILELEPGFTVDRWISRNPASGQRVGQSVAESLLAAGIPKN